MVSRAADAGILIPWRTTNCQHRTRALEYVTAHYAAEHPSWHVAVGRHDTGPWVKALAVADALTQTDAKVVVVADADVWCEGLAESVRQVESGATWAIPHRGVHRLAAQASQQYMAGVPWPDLDLAERAYLGVEGGGITVLHRDVYEACPIDPRFAGWGSEDEAHGFALRTLYGPPCRGRAALVHLWHPPQERATRSFGSMGSRNLRKRYARALNQPDVMRSLTEEARAHEPDRAPEPSPHDHAPLRVR